MFVPVCTNLENEQQLHEADPLGPGAGGASVRRSEYVKYQLVFQAVSNRALSETICKARFLS